MVKYVIFVWVQAGTMAMRAKSSFLGDTRVGDEHDDSGVLLALHLPGGTRQA